ncbi:MAG: ABC transporter permease subunit [Myxococcota bacterium]
MSAVWLIVMREVRSYASTWSGYLVGASLLLLSGLLYNVYGIGDVPQYSRDVLRNAFYFLSGTTLVAGILFAMRLIAEERQTGSIKLLLSAPISDSQLVLAKFLAGFVPLLAYVAASMYIPLLVFFRGEVAFGHVAAGALGLVLLGSAGVSIGLFGSCLFKSQLVAAMVSGVIAVVMILLWQTSKIVDGPLGEAISALALHDRHFFPFMEGTISTANVVYYLSVTLFFLALSRNVMEASRWRV